MGLALSCKRVTRNDADQGNQEDHGDVGVAADSGDGSRGHVHLAAGRHDIASGQ